VSGAAGLLAALAQVVSIGSAFWLGGGLIRRGLRERRRPELLLGAHLFLALGVGSLLLTVVSAASYQDTGLGPATLTAMAVVGNSIVIFGLMAALWFNYDVFHGGKSAGRLLAWTCTVLMWAGFAWLALKGGLSGPDPFGRVYLPFGFAMVLADLWVAADALRFRAQLVKRLALGLAEPIVVERLALWGYGALARIGLVAMAPIVSALHVSAERRVELAPALYMLSGFLILTTCVAYWLMLAPTEGYRRWVERRYATARAH
jgi:hypothetical protein